MADWQQPVRGLSQVAAEPSCLSVRGLTKSYGSVLALDNFSLDFAGGQCTVLLGPERLRQDDGAALHRRAD